jgi:thioredoxin reductase (NADPH)
MWTSEVENFPGFEHGVDGKELMAVLQKQAERVGARVSGNWVTRVDLSQRPFKIYYDNDFEGTEEQMLLTHSIIVSTGASANYLGLPTEREFENRGVSACAVCDGALPRFREQPLVVVGGGDTALEEATYLTKFASRVHLVHRRDSLRGSKIMADRALANPKIVPVWNTVVEEVVGNDVDGVTGVHVKNVQNNTSGLIEARGMFVAIGHTPNTKFLGGQVATDKTGYLLLKDGFRSETSVEGVFAAGDCADSVYRQAVTAAGMGCKAAIDAERWLAAQGIH